MNFDPTEGEIYGNHKKCKCSGPKRILTQIPVIQDQQTMQLVDRYYNFHKNSNKFGIGVVSSLIIGPLILSGIIGIILASILTLFGVEFCSRVSEKVDFDNYWKRDYNIITVLVNEYVLNNPITTENKVFYYVTNKWKDFESYKCNECLNINV